MHVKADGRSTWTLLVSVRPKLRCWAELSDEFLGIFQVPLHDVWRLKWECVCDSYVFLCLYLRHIVKSAAQLHFLKYAQACRGSQPANQPTSQPAYVADSACIHLLSALINLIISTIYQGDVEGEKERNIEGGRAASGVLGQRTCCSQIRAWDASWV